MILTGSKFAACCRALAGPRWKTAVSPQLGKSVRTLTDYASGITNVPREVRKKLAVLLYAQGSAQVRLALELDPDVAKAAGKSAVDMG